jgi:fluoride exporter
MLLNFLMVFLGGGAGSVTRLSASLLLPSRDFPFATLVVNLVGCLAAGVVLARLVPAYASLHPTRLLLMTGFLGGLTTFSAFGLETIALLKDGRTGLAAANIAANVVGSLLATWLGWMLTK